MKVLTPVRTLTFNVRRALSMPNALRMLYLGTSLSLSMLAMDVSAKILAPDDSALRYVGRFDSGDPAGPLCSWSASSVAFTVSSGSSSVRLKDGGKNYWQVVINGEPTKVLALKAGEQDYVIATDLPKGTHTIELVKRTEASQGATQILGFDISEDAQLLPTPERMRRIEVIGDSISCGYGNEAPTKEHKFTPETENAWLTYGAVAARAVDADLVCIAWSGKKMWPDNTIGEIYDRVAPNATKSKWDFSSWIPDVVVINLGTNDFNHGNPEASGWIRGYVDFIRSVQVRYPDAPIYCTVGPMISNWPGDRKPRETILGYMEEILAEANKDGSSPVRFLDFGVQAQHHGIGADWHPSVKTHSIMGKKLATALKQDMNW